MMMLGSINYLSNQWHRVSRNERVVNFSRSLDTERLSEQQNDQGQVEMKSSSSSMAGSDDSLDKSDLDENNESQDNYKSFQSSPIILELGQKIGSDRSAFVRHGTPVSNGHFDHSRESPSSTVVEDSTSSGTNLHPRISDNTNERKSIDRETTENRQPQQPQRKKNPYSIEELLKKDESKTTIKRPRLVNTGIVQPCGIVVGKELL